MYFQQEKKECILLIMSILLLSVTYTVRPNLQHDPLPNPKSVVVVFPQARFTVLTAHMIRMEWGGNYDRATFTFINRNLPAPEYTVDKDGDWIVIQTAAMKIYYLPNNKTFSSDNLKVQFSVTSRSIPNSWSPQPGRIMTGHRQMLGTLRSLDRTNGGMELDCMKQPRADLHCSLGLMSRDGYVVIDDTNHPQFDDSQWPWVINTTLSPPDPDQCSQIDHKMRYECGYLNINEFDCTGRRCCYDNSTADTIPSCYYTHLSYQDLYFFAHGVDFKLALKEFTLLSGAVPIPPRYAFGIYYSKYQAHNDVGEIALVNEYKKRGIPLDILVLDMDWHVTFYDNTKDQAGQRKGWTGYTWDRHLFPDPQAFLDWVKRRGLRIALNIHAASGIQTWEDTYTQMAEANGIDPNTKLYVPFKPSDRKFVDSWCEITLTAREKEGVDFWWLDWNQGEDNIRIPLVNPTFWQNYIFFTNPYHWNEGKRPIILHRWGGLGNHRYPLGFSGDVIPSWTSLQFQISFTVSASNVLFGYWSHDIGGHTAPVDPELYTRWVQWGVFSPVFRPHSGKQGNNTRLIWEFPNENYVIMREAFILRQALVPYIYTAARQAYDHGISLLRPLYYEHPQVEDAFKYSSKQYFFGPDLLVSPVTNPVDSTTGLFTGNYWMPGESSYISWFSGEVLNGGVVSERSYSLLEIPVWVKAGSVIPMMTDDSDRIGSSQENPNKLKLMIFFNCMNSSSVGEVVATTTIYEDEGDSVSYKTGEFSQTTVNVAHSPKNFLLDIDIGAAVGKFNGMPLQKSYQIIIPNFWPVDSVTVDSTTLPYTFWEESFAEYTEDSWTYDGSSLSLIINLVSKRPVNQNLKVSLNYNSFKNFNPFWYQGYKGRLKRLMQVKEILDCQWGEDTVHQQDYPSLLSATETGIRINYNVQDIVNITSSFQLHVESAIQEVESLKGLDEKLRRRIVALLSSNYM